MLNEERSVKIQNTLKELDLLLKQFSQETLELVKDNNLETFTMHANLGRMVENYMGFVEIYNGINSRLNKEDNK